MFLLIGSSLIFFICSMESPASQLFALRLPLYERHGPVYQRRTFRQVLAYGRA